MYSQNRNWAASVPMSTFMCLWAIYIFPGWVPHIFSCRPIVGIYKPLTQTHECGNWNWGRAVFFLGIFVFEFSVLCLCSEDLDSNALVKVRQIVKLCNTFFLNFYNCKSGMIELPFTAMAFPMAAPATMAGMLTPWGSGAGAASIIQNRAHTTQKNSCKNTYRTLLHC